MTEVKTTEPSKLVIRESDYSEFKKGFGSGTRHQGKRFGEAFLAEFCISHMADQSRWSRLNETTDFLEAVRIIRQNFNFTQ